MELEKFSATEFEIVDFSKGEEFLQENDLIRLLQYKSDTAGSLTWITTTKAIFSDIVYYVKRVHPGALPMRRRTYTNAPVNTPIVPISFHQVATS